ncbi:hypothetical protein [Desulforhopalus sp. IMCC35007]|uniref:hypothetical protein n=1 Tax=Desulforhopalus sp. IMCC35007 TaxID=2569543 RepID=UPI0010AE8306|nr:hypothetical protein [Desulforhopalus sp. IMCC35007]TKB11117.1 hypothetical protein FCL48_03655 [Desulforhopalus sp. IMCC35007]
MQKIVDELKKILPFKNTTDIGDIIVIAAKEPQMLLYAHVDDIERDTSRKDEWWHVHMSMLSIPLQKVTWTLRTEQISGQEIFTMGGEERFIQAIEFGGASKANVSAKASKKKNISPLKRVK